MTDSRRCPFWVAVVAVGEYGWSPPDTGGAGAGLLRARTAICRTRGAGTKVLRIGENL